MEQAKDVIEFWFQGWKPGQAVTKAQSDFWFSGKSESDDRIRSRFQGLVEQALTGKLRDWEDSPTGSLALIICLDQFTRNIHRAVPEAFSGDAHALRVALRGIDRGWDRELHPVERVFFYLPLEHAEDVQVQQKSLDHFIRLAQQAPEEEWDFIDEALNFAISHHEVIERFGRFPQRNTILGRASTTDELAFMEEVQPPPSGN